MKVNINIVEKEEQELADIYICKMTDSIKQAQALLSESTVSVNATLDGDNYLIDINKIYYIESVDNKSFIFLKTGVYESKLKLYELEDILDKNRFLRCSKSMIVNIRKIKSIKSSINSRIDATLLNDEKIIISRSYVKELKKMLGM